MGAETRPDFLEVVREYHERTKHHPQRYARSPGYMDWSTQPDPFRRYSGSPMVDLPFAEEDTSPPYEALYTTAVDPAPLSLSTVGVFFENALALSAWKEFQGGRWALRCNPSSGNLHPTEGYLVTGPVAGLCDRGAVFHYAPKEHGLELRAELDDGQWVGIASSFPKQTFFVGLTSIFWREAWKYGERAFRYCQHDAGHAIGALAVSAAALGWRAVGLEGLADTEVSTLLGIDRDSDYGECEREHPDLLVAIVPSDYLDPIPRTIPSKAIEAIASSRWRGVANQLSSGHVDWPVIDQVAFAAGKRRTEAVPYVPGILKPDRMRPSEATSRQIVQQRRSAVDMDGSSTLACDDFYTMLLRCMPSPGALPWAALAQPPAIHLGMFVHRVAGLEAGLYFLVRDPDRISDCRRALDRPALWQRPEDCPDDLPLYLIEAGDFKQLAAGVSCGQSIAGNGAFSLGMIAAFDASAEKHGPWFYRRLHWETGLIGQVLYLEAEAAGLRSTGIGCYFDDAVHNVFGLSGTTYQSMYHFTVGGAVEDERLTTLPPYDTKRL